MLLNGNPVSDPLPVTERAHAALARERDKLLEERAISGDRMIVDARLARLEDILGRATIVESGSTVAIGSSVTVLDRGTGEPVEYVIESSYAAAIPRSVSAVSPVGKALLGRRPGDAVTVELPRQGRTRALEILAVRPLSAP